MLGLFFPWRPAEEPNAPAGAVLRVISPEGEPYNIVWGHFSSSDLGMVDGGRAYEDYTVPPEAGDPSDGYNVLVEKVAADGESPDRLGAGVGW